MRATAPGTGSCRSFSRTLTSRAWSTGRCPWTRRSPARTSTRRTRPVLSGTQGATSNHTPVPDGFVHSPRGGDREPAGHGIGRSRGGLTTKIHVVVDGGGLPLAAVVTGGQRNDGAMLAQLLADIRVPRRGPGRPRTRPDALLADRVYSSTVNRTMLARRGIRVVIPEKKDTIAARQRKGSAGGRPRAFDAQTYKRRNVIERHFNTVQQWRGMATRAA